MNLPHTLSVYSFQMYDHQMQRLSVAPYKATADRIAELSGEALQDTEEQVPCDEIDLLGCYSRTVSSWADLE